MPPAAKQRDEIEIKIQVNLVPSLRGGMPSLASCACRLLDAEVQKRI
jgi:hypothetical protein